MTKPTKKAPKIILTQDQVIRAANLAGSGATAVEIAAELKTTTTNGLPAASPARPSPSSSHGRTGFSSGHDLESGHE
jgi:hypothetical protein